MARRKYEEVVDRNVKNPPPPRDPALLEKVGDGVYELSVFPVALDSSRKLRIRYLMPTVYRDSANRSPFPFAFSRSAEVIVRGGEGIEGYALTSMRSDNQRVTTIELREQVTSPIRLDADAYGNFQPRNPWNSGNQSSHLLAIAPILGESYGSRAIFATTQSSQGEPGFASHFIFHPPVEILDRLKEGGDRITASITSESDSVTKQITTLENNRLGVEQLRVYSSSALAASIAWRLFDGDELIDEIEETPEVIRFEDGNQFLRTFAWMPFYPMSRTMPASLATSWGFIDSRYALLALEQDTLTRELQEQFTSAGVPGLDPGDIFAEDDDSTLIPISAWLLQRNINPEDLLLPTSIAALNAYGLPTGIRWLFRDGFVHIEIDPSANFTGLQLSLHSIDGKEIKRWGKAELAGGRVTWSPGVARYKGGICLLRVTSGTQSWSARVLLR
jgi:hypothetical protein